MLSQQISQFEPPLKMGKGPIYRAKDSTLHFSDFPGRKVHVLPIVAETGEVDTSRSPVVRETVLGGSDGIGFSPDLTKLYFNDSLAQMTYAWDFDIEADEISNPWVVRSFRSTEFEPSGLMVDTNGHIWTTRDYSGTVLCMTAQGKTVHEIAIGAERLVGLTWGVGGKNNDILFVTTILGDGKGDGQIFKIQTDVQGLPTYKRPIKSKLYPS